MIKENPEGGESMTKRAFIGLGFEYILKNIHITRAYLKQVGMPDKDIDSIINAPELKEAKEEDLTEREKEEKLKDFYQSLAENYQGKFQEEVREVAANMLEKI